MDPYEQAAASAEAVAALTKQDRHEVAIVLGSGWLPAAEAIAALSERDPVDVDYGELGGFPEPTVPGHAGRARSVQLGGRQVLVFMGRVHAYEGHGPATVVHGVRTAVAAGCATVMLTNAAGGLRLDYHVGQAVLIGDHINLTGLSPLTGAPPPAGYSSRFVDLTNLYSPALRASARELDPSLVEGVYAALPGPHYETRAEIAMLRGLGADLVGMSTVLEAIAARHLGAEVFAVSLVTNLAAGLDPAHETVDHEEVLAAGAASAGRIGTLLASLITKSL